jgi:hypothetical protein
MDKLLIISLLCIGCGPQPAPHIPVTVDPILAPYLQSFAVNVGVSTGGISANFAPLYNSLAETVGECISYSNGDRVIQIDPTFWALAANSPGQQEQLLYHELGHCALNVGHTFTFNGPDGGCPTSIMYPYVFDSAPNGDLLWCYTDNKQWYWNEESTL